MSPSRLRGTEKMLFLEPLVVHTPQGTLEFSGDLQFTDFLPSGIMRLTVPAGMTGASNSEAIPVTGVWRLWCEHGGDKAFVQGAAFPEPTNTNPDHVFEIHPITAIGRLQLLGSFVPVHGFKPGGGVDRNRHGYCALSTEAPVSQPSS